MLKVCAACVPQNKDNSMHHLNIDPLTSHYVLYQHAYIVLSKHGPYS